MATNYTTNYQLNQWEPTDQVLRTEFNVDNAKIDAALAELGTFRIETGTYVGAGNTISKSLTLARPPVFVVVASTISADLLFLFQGAAYGTAFLADNPTSSQFSRMRSVWNGNTITWSKFYTSTDDKSYMDQSGETYRYIALVSG